jgi:hypothetical protein
VFYDEQRGSGDGFPLWSWDGEERVAGDPRVGDVSAKASPRPC